MPLPAKLPASSSKTLTSLNAEKTDVLANRYFIQTTLGSGNCGIALLVEDRKDKDGKEKLLVLGIISLHFWVYKYCKPSSVAFLTKIVVDICASCTLKVKTLALKLFLFYSCCILLRYFFISRLFMYGTKAFL